MKETTTIANAMDSLSKAVYFRNSEGEVLPGIRMAVEFSNNLPTAVVEGIMDAYTDMQSAVLKSLRDSGCITAEE